MCYLRLFFLNFLLARLAWDTFWNGLIWDLNWNNWTLFMNWANQPNCFFSELLLGKGCMRYFFGTGSSEIWRYGQRTNRRPWTGPHLWNWAPSNRPSPMIVWFRENYPLHFPVKITRVASKIVNLHSCETHLIGFLSKKVKKIRAPLPKCTIAFGDGHWE